MKRIKLLTFLVLVLCLFCMTSCKKVTEFNNQDYGKVDYYVAGLYIQVNKYDELEMSDPNPKIYYDFSNSTRFGVLSTKSGSKDAAMSITDIGKDEKLEDNIKKYYMTANVRFVNSDVEETQLLNYAEKWAIKNNIPYYIPQNRPNHLGSLLTDKR